MDLRFLFVGKKHIFQEGNFYDFMNVFKKNALFAVEILLTCFIYDMSPNSNILYSSFTDRKFEIAIG